MVLGHSCTRKCTQVSLLRDSGLDLTHQVIVPVLEARVLLDVLMLLAELIEAVATVRELLNERVVLPIEDLQLNPRIGQLRQLDCLLEEAYAAFFERNTTNAVIVYFLYGNLSSTH